VSNQQKVKHWRALLTVHTVLHHTEYINRHTDNNEDSHTTSSTMSDIMSTCHKTPFVLVRYIWSQPSDSCDMRRCTGQRHVHEKQQTATGNACVGLGSQTSDSLLQTSTTDEHCDAHSIVHMFDKQLQQIQRHTTEWQCQWQWRLLLRHS